MATRPPDSPQPDDPLLSSNKKKLALLNKTYPHIESLDAAAEFLSAILMGLLLQADRPVDEEFVAISSCKEMLSKQPKLYKALQEARLTDELSLTAFADSLSPSARSYLDQLRANRQNVANVDSLFNRWDPRRHSKLEDEGILKFLETLKLYRMSTKLSIILFELGEFSNDPVLRDRVSSIFTPTNKFLVNTSGSGKTRLCYEGLCVNWGFYMTLKIDSGRLGSFDAEHLLERFRQDTYRHSVSSELEMNVEKNVEQITTLFGSILLTRLLLLLLYLETVEVDSSGFSEKHKKHWLSMQLVTNNFARFYTDPFNELSRILWQHDSAYLAQNIHRALNQIRSILGEEEPLFIVLDEASLAVEKFSDAFGGNSLLQVIIQGWMDLTDNRCTIICAGIQIPQARFKEGAGSDFGWTSNTGAFDDPVRQEGYITKFLPPTLRDSASGRFFIARAWRWLRGRHRATAAVMAALLVEGLQHPHSRLDYFIERAISFQSVDAIEYVSAEGRTAPWGTGFHTFTFNAMTEENKRLFVEILFRYMATHDASPPLGPDRMELVYIDFARVADAALSEIVLDEPLPLLGVARTLLPNPEPPTDYWERPKPPATFLQSLRLNIPPNAESLSHCLVFYLTQVLGKGRRLDKVFSFPHRAPDWAKQPGQLVRFHRLDSDEVSWSPVASYDFESFRPLAKEAASVEETLEWLEHQHGTAFCLPSLTNVDLLFVVRLADESFVWVVLKALATDEPIHPPELQTALSQLQADSLFGDVDAELQSRLEKAVDSLPNTGSCRILRVISSFPVEITVLDESVSKGTKDVAVLSLSRLESTRKQVMQTDFFDAIAAGVLAGHKRKSRWDDGPLHTSSKRLNLKRKSYATDSDSSVAADDDDDEREETPKRAPTAKRAKKQPAGAQ
ncbi:hypothetical protein C8F01DRAFT_1364186 [Mycena amicta]|nr:hypothetical protein C8F01DRAFT_1364186 [Mycena amicta]